MEEVKFIFSMDDQFSKQAKQAENNVGSLESKLMKMGGLVAGAFSVGAVASFAKSTLDSFGKFEQFQTSLTTMFHGNRREAELLTGQLQDFAKATPFELTEIQEATKMMIAYGSTSGGVVKEMNMLGDISSGVGAPLKDIAYLYGTLRTQGRAYAVDIRQFAGRGIPIIDALAKTMGVAKNEVMKLVEQGKVGFPQVEHALKSLTEQGGQFAGMMKEQSKTLDGQISNLKDGWEQLKISIGESQSGIVKSTVAWATEMINSMNDAQRAANDLGKAFKRGGVKEYNIFGGEVTDMGAETGFHKKYGAYNQQILGGVKSASEVGTGAELALANKQIQLSNAIKVLVDKSERGLIAPKDFLAEYGVLKNAKEMGQTYLEQIRANKAKQKEDADAMKSKTKESSKIKQQQYTNITINIDKMTGIENLETKDNKTIASDAGEQIVRMMVEATEDSQIVAGI